ncbi:hypothetical protein [Oryza sativa Japonica Group]|uniref:Uncharacterized protein P0031D11.24 n=1 Tax=Oryza sativa subsp. japonica TaxID=39947 RepID=Q5NA11_ORYSJ|nr:hypothetical protein [Oryza sativa Japonica Group]
MTVYGSFDRKPLKNLANFRPPDCFKIRAGNQTLKILSPLPIPHAPPLLSAPPPPAGPLSSPLPQVGGGELSVVFPVAGGGTLRRPPRPTTLSTLPPPPSSAPRLRQRHRRLAARLIRHLPRPSL